jgi:protein involved in polysaccharide export with SLBB domain
MSRFQYVASKLLIAALLAFASGAHAQFRPLQEDASAQAQAQPQTYGNGAATMAPTINGSGRAGLTTSNIGGGGIASGRSAETIDATPRSLQRLAPEPPTQFQRFVQQATGKMLPHFGSQLFDAAQSFTPDTSLPVPANYVIGPGDEIWLQVWGAVDFSTSMVVDRNGQVMVPRVGVVPLAGVAVRDLETVLRNSLSKVFTNFSVNANLGRLRSIQIYVVGQARQPGTYVVSSLSTLVNALFVSGGPSANGSMRNIQLQRAGKLVTEFDIYDFIARGDKSHDAALMPGDVIVMPPVGPRVAVTGALDLSAIYELKPGTSTVSDILGLGGGVPALASTHRALLERVDPAKSPARQVLDLTLDNAGLQQVLHDGDVLTLLAISPAFFNAVTLQGAVADPVRHRWFPGMRILDLIPAREALIPRDFYRRKNLLVQNEDSTSKATGQLSEGIAGRVRGAADQINWDYAVVERFDRNKLTTQLIPFNLGKAVIERDPANNVALEPGDVVTILSQRDLQLPIDRQVRLVRVEGEVAAPGVYQALAGETLPQLIRRIGGLTPQAYVFGAELNRESVRLRQQENLDTLTRRLESQLQSQAASAGANLGPERAAQAQLLLQQQQIQMKSQLERLKAFKSNGRVALELDPLSQSIAALPQLPLEDGDRFLIPAVPGFVAAFGSVNNENVFVYKPGKTVGDVLKSAGLTEDAEPDQAFVLRADGSIIARRDRGGLFGSGFESLQVMPGDTVVVPAQFDRESRYNFITRALKDWTQIFSNFGLGLAAIKTIKSL